MNTSVLRLLERNGALRRVLGAQFVSTLGDGFNAVAVAFAVLSLTDSKVALSLVLAARVVGLSVAVLGGGVIADRYERRRVMVGADLARFVSQAFVAGALLSGHGTIAVLAATQLIHGLASGCFQPASASYVPSIVAKEDLQRVNGALVGFLTVGSIAGPAMAGFLTAGFGPGVALAVDAATFALSAALLIGVPRSQPQRCEARTSMLTELADGAREVWVRPWLRVGILYFLLSQFFFDGPVHVLGPLYAQDRLGGAAAWGALMSALGVGSFLGSLVAGRYDARRPLLMIVGAAVGPVAVLCAFGLGAGMLPLLLALPLAGAAATYADVTWWSTLQRQIPDAALSRVMAWDLLGYTASRPASMMVAAPAVAVAGLSPVFLVAAGGTAIAALGVLSVQSSRDLVWSPEQVPDARRPGRHRAGKRRRPAPGRRRAGVSLL